VRVSTADQNLGPDAQRRAIEVWARTNGIQVVAWHADQGISGSSDLDDRPGLVAALAELRLLGAGVLVVAKRDRLARDVYVAAICERAVDLGGARVVCADGVGNGETPADAFMRTILDAAAAYERALIRGRTVAALAVKRGRGERVGSVPYGFQLADDRKTLHPSPTEQQSLVALRAMRVAGLSYRQIRAEATRRGILSRKGRPFSLRAIYAMSTHRS
jgi:DNA invertase Pin-like site-specific DNA recombinase